MKMGLVTSTNRHTAFDSTVVFHEFMHGVTNRLVGGPLNVRALDAPQSGGMGEGWGDYVACTITGRTVVGDVGGRQAGRHPRVPLRRELPGQLRRPRDKAATTRCTTSARSGARRSWS